MDAGGRHLLWKASGGAVLALVLATAFAAYLRPDMLVSFANLILCY